MNLSSVRRWIRKRAWAFDLEWSRGMPRLILHEAHESKVKWTLRALTFLGLTSSVIVFSSWYVSLGTALILVGVEQFLERAVFHYTTWFIHPLPEFEYEPDRWVGMGFGVRTDDDAPNVVGFAFDDRDYAASFLRLLRAWNLDEDEDVNGNIELWFLWDDERSYHLLVYPSMNRPPVVAARDLVDEESLRERPGRRQLQIAFQVVFCKGFEDHGNLRRFLADQAIHPRPFLLAAGTWSGSGHLDPTRTVPPVLMHRLHTARWADLERTSFPRQFRDAQGF